MSTPVFNRFLIVLTGWIFAPRRTITGATAGALDRHPELKVLISEGGATWVPFLGDRMTEGYRQHSMMVRPQLSRTPKEILYSQVYASFQHDETAVAAVEAPQGEVEVAAPALVAEAVAPPPVVIAAATLAA